VTSVTRDGIPTEIRAWAAAALACMGVVFGDIGTSPLYSGRQTWPPLSCLSRNSFFANWVLRSSLQ